VVACTTLGLPYQQGTDAPCDLSEVWCLFADVVESALIVTDNIVNRTAVGVPFAKVAKTTTTVFPVQAFGFVDVSIPFDTVFADNDNMVDLSGDNLRVLPTRAGIYQVDAMITCIPELLTQRPFATIVNYPFQIFPPAVGVFYNNLSQTCNVHVTTMHEFNSTDFLEASPPSFSLILSTQLVPAFSDITVFAADMTVTWMAEATS